MKGTTNGIAWEKRSFVDDACPLLLLRPLGGSVALWGAFGDELARHFRLVTFDARGSGFSSGAPRVSVRVLAEDACRVLDACRIERAHVFGISLGGMIAQRLAISFSSRVHGLTLASTAARGVAFERAGWRRAMGFARCLAHSPARTERCLVCRVLSPEFRRDQPLETARIETVAARTPSPRSTIVAHALAALRHDASRDLGRIRARTLVLFGDRDRLLGSTPSIDLARKIPGSERAIVERAGHDLTLERPLETARLVTEFLLRVP